MWSGIRIAAAELNFGRVQGVMSRVKQTRIRVRFKVGFTKS